MKSAVFSAIALLLLSLPVQAQGTPTDQKLKDTLETLRQLNKLPTNAPRNLRTRGAPQPEQSAVRFGGLQDPEGVPSAADGTVDLEAARAW